MKGAKFERMEQSIVNRTRKISLSLSALSLGCALSGCRRSPTFNILGSFFPSWLICLFAGILLAVVFNRVLAYFNLDREIAWTIVVYPCLSLFFACMLWLILFS